MMEWCHSVDCWRAPCSISSTSIERVSIREECDLLVVGGGEEHWRRRVFVDVMLD